MTLTNSNAENIFQGDGVATVFPTTIRAYDEDQIVVYLRENDTDSLQTLTTHYTLSGIAAVTSPASTVVTVTMLDAPDANQELVVVRATPLTQETRLTTSRAFSGETLERQFDLITMMIQEMKEQVDRSFKVAPGLDATTPVFDQDSLANLITYAETAAAAAASVIARAPSYYDTLAQLKADTTNFPLDTMLTVRETGVTYQVKNSPTTGHLQRDDLRPINVVRVPDMLTGAEVYGGTPSVATILAAPAFLANRNGVLSAEALGIKIGSLNDDNNVTRMADVAPEIVGGDISKLTFGPGSFYFSNTVANLEGSNFVLEGLGKGLTSLVLSSDTGSHRGKFIKLGGFADVYVFTATAGQVNFSGVATSGGTLTFTVSSVLTVQVNGEDVDFTSNSGTQTVTLEVAAALNDKVRIEVSTSTYGRIKMRGFTFDCLSGTADQNQPFINLGAIADFEMTDIRVLSRVAGLIRCGYEGTVARTVIRDVMGNIDPLNSTTCIDIAQAGNFEMHNVFLTGPRDAGIKTSQMIRLKPLSGASIDTFKLEKCALYCADGVNRNMEIDMTDGSVTNVWLDQVTFDQGIINNVRVIDGGATFARWARNFWTSKGYFRLTRESPNASARNILVDITGSNTRLDNFAFQGLLGFGPASAVRVAKSNAGSQINGFKIHHTEFAHQETDAGATPVTACVDIEAENVSIKDCFVAPAFHSSVVRVNYFARTTGDVDGFEITRNDNTQCLLGDMLHTTYAAASEARIVEGNKKPTLREYSTTAGTNRLDNKTHAINRAGKFKGKIVMHSNTGFPVYASGPADTDPWNYCHDNTTCTTPA